MWTRLFALPPPRKIRLMYSRTSKRWGQTFQCSLFQSRDRSTHAISLFWVCRGGCRLSAAITGGQICRRFDGQSNLPKGRSTI